MIPNLTTIPLCQWLTTAGALALWAFLTRWRWDSPYLLSFVRLPGTVGHELMHYLVATLFRASPQIPHMAPTEEAANQFSLGSVNFVAKPLSAFFVAVAPLLLVVPISFLAWHILQEPCLAVSRIWQSYLLWALLDAMWPSRTDWAIAAEYPLGGLLLATGVGMAALQWYH